METPHKTQRQRNRKDDAQSHCPQNEECVPRLEVEDSRRPEEGRKSPRNAYKEQGAQSVSTTVSPLSTRSICSPFKFGQSRPKYEVFSMLEYLTLSQLEDIWRRQDAYKDYVDMPQRTPDLMPTNDGAQHTSPYQDVDGVPTRKEFSLSNMTKDRVFK